MTHTRMHILRVRTGKDFEVVEGLLRIGIEAISVVCRRESVHRRTKVRTARAVPFLSGYVFASVPEGMWPHVRNVPEVLSPIRAGGGAGDPATVSAQDVVDLQEAVELSAPTPDKLPLFSVGQEVSFDMFGVAVRAVVSEIKGDTVVASTKTSGKRVTIARVADEFRAVA